jgi:hypothetical protein
MPNRTNLELPCFRCFVKLDLGDFEGSLEKADFEGSLEKADFEGSV